MDNWNDWAGRRCVCCPDDDGDDDDDDDDGGGDGDGDVLPKTVLAVAKVKTFWHFHYGII